MVMMSSVIFRGVNEDLLETTPDFLLLAIIVCAGAWLLGSLITKWHHDRNRELDQLEQMALRYSHKKTK